MHPITMNTPHVIGIALRRLRDQRTWTRPQLREQLNTVIGVDLSTQTIATYETGERAITAIRLAELCHVLGARTSDLWSEVDDMLTELTGNHDNVAIDLDKILRTSDDRLLPARRWALHRMQQDQASHVSTPREAISSLAYVCDIDPVDLLSLIRTDPEHASTATTRARGRPSCR